MFDIGFSELLVIGIVALVVIGPERLPKVARTLGHLFGRMQRYVSQVKSDIHREMELAELGKVKSEFESAARSFESDLRSQASEAEREMRELGEGLDRSLKEPEPSPASDTALDAPEASPTTPSAAEPSPQLELGIGEPDQNASRGNRTG